MKTYKVKVYRKFHLSVLKEICSENLVALIYLGSYKTKSGKPYRLYELKSLGSYYYAKDAYFEFLSWLKTPIAKK